MANLPACGVKTGDKSLIAEFGNSGFAASFALPASKFSHFAAAPNNMAHLLSCIQQLEAVFDQCDREIAAFQKETGLHCLTNCSHCCDKKNIYASPLEFLPMALHLTQAQNDAFPDYTGKPKQKKGRALQFFLDQLEKRSQKDEATCVFHKRAQCDWGCSLYSKRGFICRLFGFSARLNKQQRPEMVTCARIKTRFRDCYNAAAGQIKDGLSVPILSHYYMRLYAIEPRLATATYPINLAIYKAFEMLYLYRF